MLGTLGSWITVSTKVFLIDTLESQATIRLVAQKMDTSG
jgi:hypothetical protein